MSLSYLNELPPEMMIPLLQQHGRDPNYVWLALMLHPPRPGATWFIRRLELKHYRPETPRNDLFDMILLKWPDVEKEGDPEMIWCVIRIPASDRHLLDQVAKETGMKIGDGVPTIFGGGKIQHFPLNGKNVFTLENSPDSILYSGGSEQIEAIEREKIRELDMELLAALRAEGKVGPNENPMAEEYGDV